MKKVALFTIAALLLGLCAVACAQEFPDVPPDHWAYDAVQELVDAGIIQGYPDGTFGGRRAMTRYEFAEALAKAIPVIAEMVDGGGPGAQGVPGPRGEQGPAGPAGPPGPGADREQLQAIQRMMDEFQDELASLGVQVESVRRDLNALNERVAAVEAEQERVRLSGNVNLYGRGEVNNTPGVLTFDRDSRALAVGAAAGEEDNPLANSDFFTDFQFGITGKVSDASSVEALIAAGDYLPFALNDVTLDDFLLWRLNLDTAIKLGPLGQGAVTVGRFPFSLTPLTLKFVDPDSYTYVDKLDEGNFVLDGGSILFNWSKIALTAFAAKSDNGIISDLITPDLLLAAAGSEIEQIGGARAVIGTPFGGNLGLTWYQAGLTTTGSTDIMGADINAMFGSIGLAAEFAQTDPDDALTALSGIATLDDDNSAWNANLAFQLGSLGLKAGFTTVEQNYYAPGYWSRLGRAVNLVNVEGPVANLTYALGNNLALSAEGQWLEPNDDAAAVNGRTALTQERALGVAGAGLAGTTVDKITYWRAGLEYGLTAANTVDLGWEQVNWEGAGAGDTDTEERYISIGLGHTFNPNASMKLLYQIVEYEQGTLLPYGVAGDRRGGVASAQFAVKF